MAKNAQNIKKKNKQKLKEKSGSLGLKQNRQEELKHLIDELRHHSLFTSKDLLFSFIDLFRFDDHRNRKRKKYIKTKTHTYIK